MAKRKNDKQQQNTTQKTKGRATLNTGGTLHRKLKVEQHYKPGEHYTENKRSSNTINRGNTTQKTKDRATLKTGGTLHRKLKIEQHYQPGEHYTEN